MPLTQRQLDAFRRVMQTGTVTAAAEQLHMSQPAVSKLLAALEYELDLKLFTRVRKRMVATSDATQLLGEVERLFGTLTDIKSFAEDLRRFDAGELRIAAAASVGQTLVADVVAELAHSHPKARIQLSVNTHVGESVIRQQADLGFSVLHFEHPAVRTLPLLHARAICAVPVGHPLAARERITPEDLADESFISFFRDSRMRQIIDAIFAQRRIARKLQYDVFSSQEAVALVARKLGIAVVEPISPFYVRPAGVVFLAFEPRVDFTVNILYPRFGNRPGLADEFASQLRARVSRLAASARTDEFPLDVRVVETSHRPDGVAISAPETP